MEKDRLFVCSYEPGTLRLSNHTNAEQLFFGFYLGQAGPPQLVDYLARMGNKCKVSFPRTQSQWIADSIDFTDDNLFSEQKIKLNLFDLNFISKKNGNFYNKELSKMGGGPRKVINSANSWLVLPSNNLLSLLHLNILYLSSFINSYN